ncbi:MAG: hypothetical protein MJZ79_02560 [Paludibacteraceae bacterium]|nr:hypothetical protein [Paludibacteraceae bacterium]
MADYMQQNITIPQASPAMAMMQGAAYAYQLEQENKRLREQLYASENPPDRPQKKVVITAMLCLLNKNGVSLANTDRSKIARLLEFLTGFSSKGILKILEEDKDFAECHQQDLATINRLLGDVNMPRLE